MIRVASYLLILLVAVFVALPQEAEALTSGATYTVVLERMNSDGTLTEVGTTTAIADSSGKITFTFAGVPTNPTVHFLVITVKDSSGNVVRRSFVPAPPAGGTNSLGVNNLSDKQTAMILKAAELVGSDDPIVMAFGLILTRAPGLSSNDIVNIATLGKRVIKDGLTGSFEQFLLDNGISSVKLNTLKDAIAYNPSGKDLSDFTSLFKSAVDNPAQAQDDMAKAGGLIADIFVDAAARADIDLAMILAAHDSAGYLVDNDPQASQALNSLSSTYKSAIEQAMTAFFMRIAYVRMAKEYTKAMTTLNATGSQITRFNQAVTTLTDNLAALDKKYAKYFEDPDNNPMTQAVQQAMNADYQQVFTTFMGDITSTDQEITAMRQNIANALNIPVADLSDVGTYYDYTGQQRNWPIPMVIVTNWVANIISAGGELTYTRDTLPIPSTITWIGSCSGTPNADQYNDQQSCESANGTWTAQRTDFTQQFQQGKELSFAALMGLREDVEIVEMTRYWIYDQNNPNTNGQPTREQEKQAKVDMINNLNNLVGNLGGTTDGSTAISTAEKKALVRLMLPPNPH